MTRELKIGDYCFVSRWSDEDPHDPWAVGFIIEITTNKYQTLYMIDNSHRQFPHARKILQEEGAKILAEGPEGILE